MTDSFDNRIASEQEAERLARGRDDEDPGPAEGTDQEQSSDAADVMAGGEGGTEPAPK